MKIMDMVQEDKLPIVAVNAIILTGSSRFILTRRADNNLWCLPGGLVDYGETVEEATKREVLEEIGVKCSIVSLVGVYSANNKLEAMRNSIIIAFTCQIDEGVPKLSDEVIEIREFNIENLPDDIIENQKIRILHALENKSEAHIL